ncbi:MAG: sigma-70 family RNA polymerase sigma factor [Aquiluna sp.]|nr:sigma-70 family RNA polymerase sigma factor [Aquiluna sp.]MCF8546173.1 sigma-70 family RNA polymerase sigma factor [Aquiluna sp.]
MVDNKNSEGFDPSNERASLALPKNEDPLELLLDEESDEEFGEAVLVEHLDANSQPLILKDWTAQDFADIYVRFYPHVLRQAKRYLTNHSQAEEITQDAFLYLMTSLPEVDSEVGVLKLLKWKTRFLALDLIKANSGARFAPIEDQPELSVDDSALSLQLERADDAAIVAMALAKLEPRQREALVASLYEEKATSEVAAQLGLNENATRQLVFRAKAAFKKALVGEAETQGLTLSEILSVAARKASRDAGKYVSVASAFLLALAISIGVIPNLGDSGEELMAVAPSTVSQGSDETSAVETEAQAPVAAEVQEELEPVSAVELAAETFSTAEPEPDSGLVANPAISESPVAPDVESPFGASAELKLASFSESIDYSPFDPWLLDPLVAQSSIKGSLLSSSTIASPNAPELITVISDEGIWADVIFQPESQTPFQNVRLGISVDENQYFANVSGIDLIVVSEDPTHETYVLVGSIGAISDVSGNIYRQTRLDGATLRLTLTVNVATGKISQTGFALAGRS